MSFLFGLDLILFGDLLTAYRVTNIICILLIKKCKLKDDTKGFGMIKDSEKNPYNIRNENAIGLNGHNAEYKFAALSQKMVTSA